MCIRDRPDGNRLGAVHRHTQQPQQGFACVLALGVNRIHQRDGENILAVRIVLRVSLLCGKRLVPMVGFFIARLGKNTFLELFFIASFFLAIKLAIKGQFHY